MDIEGHAIYTLRHYVSLLSTILRQLIKERIETNITTNHTGTKEFLSLDNPDIQEPDKNDYGPHSEFHLQPPHPPTHPPNLVAICEQ